MEKSKQRTILITGGTSGLGKALVMKFLKYGWNVATFGRRIKEIEELTGSFQSHQLLALPCDMRVEGQLEHFFDSVRSTFGSVDVCVLNAGILGPEKLPEVQNLDILDLRMTFETNFFAHFNVLKGCIKLQGAEQFIIHITSDAVKEAYPGWAAYGSSKSAMDFLIRTLHNETVEEGRKVHSFSFDPGDMDTEMHRIALPGDKNLKTPQQSADELFRFVKDLSG